MDIMMILVGAIIGFLTGLFAPFAVAIMLIVVFLVIALIPMMSMLRELAIIAVLTITLITLLKVYFFTQIATAVIGVGLRIFVGC